MYFSEGLRSLLGEILSPKKCVTVTATKALRGHPSGPCLCDFHPSFRRSRTSSAVNKFNHLTWLVPKPCCSVSHESHEQFMSLKQAANSTGDALVSRSTFDLPRSTSCTAGLICCDCQNRSALEKSLSLFSSPTE